MGAIQERRILQNCSISIFRLCITKVQKVLDLSVIRDLHKNTAKTIVIFQKRKNRYKKVDILLQFLHFQACHLLFHCTHLDPSRAAGENAEALVSGY